jgi:hypothetical protein
MKRIALLGLIVAMLATSALSARAVEPAPPDSACLSAAGIQEALVAGRALRLADIRRKLQGDIVKADLCRDNGKLAYLVTVLTPEGVVKRVTVDASSGEMMYGRH